MVGSKFYKKILVFSPGSQSVSCLFPANGVFSRLSIFRKTSDPFSLHIDRGGKPFYSIINIRQHSYSMNFLEKVQDPSIYKFSQGETLVFSPSDKKHKILLELLIELDNQGKKQDQSRKKCDCAIDLLMRAGCKCGGI